MLNRSIIILTQYFPPEMGAPQSRLYEMAAGLQQSGWIVEVITALPNYPTGRIFPAYCNRLSYSEQIGNIPVHRYWIYASNSRRALPRIVSMMSFCLISLSAIFLIRKVRPAYLIVESPPLLLGLSGWLMSRLSEAKLILNISDIWPLSAAELGATRKDSLFYRLLEGLERFLYRNAFACTGQSDEIIRHLQMNGARKAWLFRNGVDAKRFHPPVEKEFSKPLKIVYAGLLGVAQGILALCKNLQFDPKLLEFHIYGAGAELEAIAGYLQKSGKKGITLHEPLAREAVPGMLAQYDLTLIPLKKPIYGAVPSKIYEAMAAGLPIVFAGGGEGAAIVQAHDAGWICEPSDFSAMQQLLDEILSLPAEVLLAKRSNGLRAAQKVFHRDIQIGVLNGALRSSQE